MTPNLERAVRDFVTAFNGGKWGATCDLLDANVILTKVDDTKPPIIGKDRVYAYMNDKCEKEHPQFQALPHILSNEDDSYAIVSGIARYLDKQGDPEVWRIMRYLFALRQDPEKGWLFLLLYGKVLF